MTENTQPETTETESNDDVVVEPNFVQKFANNHPRTAKVVAIAGAVLTVGSVATIANTVRKNRSHLDAATDHLSEATAELSNAVSPSPETDA
jgi:hypothetical protein